MTDLKTILITGATSGIGATTARLLIDAGHNVAITGRNADKLNAFVEQLDRPNQTLGIRADAADWDVDANTMRWLWEQYAPGVSPNDSDTSPLQLQKVPALPPTLIATADKTTGDIS